jgi:hypothetical protein
MARILSRIGWRIDQLACPVQAPSNGSLCSRATKVGNTFDCCRPRTTTFGATMEAMVRMVSLFQL